MQIARMLREHTGVISLNLRGTRPFDVILAEPSELARSALPHCSGVNKKGLYRLKD